MTEVTSDSWQVSDTELFARFGDAFVPRRREQIATVCDLLVDIPRAEVLDLCCGEGQLSEEVLRRFPQVRVTALDSSTEMLDLAAQRLRPFGERRRLTHAQLENRDWRHGSYGAIITSLAVHHLDGDGKKVLYTDLCAMLEPGGVFVMADLVEPASAVSRRLAAEHWDRAVEQTSQQQYGGGAASEAFRESQWNHYRWPDPVDMPSTVADNLDWLRSGGFAAVDVYWAYAGHVIIGAWRGAAT